MTWLIAGLILVAAAQFLPIVGCVFWKLPRRPELRWERAAEACVRCRYDLRGNVSGTCPECGMPIFRRPAPEAATEAGR